MVLDTKSLRDFALSKLRDYLPASFSNPDLDIGKIINFERAIDGEGIYIAGTASRLAIVYDGSKKEATEKARNNSSFFREGLFGVFSGKYDYQMKVVEDSVNPENIGCIVAGWIRVSRR